ncbi:helix-turn-helix domain-containing protein [Hungatella hathewayi]
MGKAVAKCPPYRLIASVADGDEKAIEKMLQFYDAYLSKCLHYV